MYRPIVVPIVYKTLQIVGNVRLGIKNILRQVIYANKGLQTYYLEKAFTLTLFGMARDGLTIIRVGGTVIYQVFSLSRIFLISFFTLFV